MNLIPTWHGARRYGKGPDWVRDFVRHYGYDLTNWPGFPFLYAMRDLVQSTDPLHRAPHSPPHAQVLRQRVNGLRSDDTSTVWIVL